MLFTALEYCEFNHLGNFFARLVRENKKSVPTSIASVMKEAKEEGSFEKPEDRKKCKKCEESPSQPCCSGTLAEQRAYPDEGGSHAMRQ